MIQNSACGNTVQVALYTNAIARLVNDRGTIGLAALGLFGLVSCVIVLAVLLKNV